MMRTLVVFLLQYSNSINFTSVDYQTIYLDLVITIYGILTIIDFIQFVHYSRKFYLHLKSREKEIRLFYFDKEAYLDSKYLRIHLKIATILVGTAFFFYTLASTPNLFVVFRDISCYIPIPQQLNQIFLTVFGIYTSFISNFSLLICDVHSLAISICTDPNFCSYFFAFISLL